MNLNEQIQEATDKFITENLPELVSVKVSKMIDGILEDVFRSYGNVSKSIKEKIEENLDINLQKFDVVDYNHLVSKAINDHLLHHVNIQPIIDLCQDAIGFVNKKTITISEIANMFKQSAMENNKGGRVVAAKKKR